MKVCPQCSSVYGDDFVYCSNDGTILIEKQLISPTETDNAEAETIIRRDPFVIDFNEPLPTPAETVEMTNQALPQVAPIVVEKTSNSKFYALFLLVGLLIGGTLVLVTLLAARFINRPSETDVSIQTKTNENRNQKSPENINAERDTEVDKIADEIHQKRDADKPDEDFNGRVIVANANVRSAPRSNAKQVDILLVDDRISIERRDHSNSPWYYVSCEHGISGWMHGNTIEFTDGYL